MKKLFLVLAIILPLIACAQQSDSDDNTEQYVWREGWHAGIGIGEFYPETFWNYRGSNEAGMAGDDIGHSVKRTMVMLSLEKRSVFGKKREKDFRDYYTPVYYTPDYIYFGSFKFYPDFDFGVDLLGGVAGKTTANFLEDGNNVISSGGWSFGTDAYFRMSAVAPLPKCNIIFLSIGIQPQFLMIHNNAKGVSALPLAENYRNNPWTESVFMFNGSIGTLGFEFKKISILPELRLGLFGTSSSTFKVNGEGLSKREAPDFWGFNIKLMTRL